MLPVLCLIALTATTASALELPKENTPYWIKDGGFACDAGYDDLCGAYVYLQSDGLVFQRESQARTSAQPTLWFFEKQDDGTYKIFDKQNTQYYGGDQKLHKLKVYLKAPSSSTGWLDSTKEDPGHTWEVSEDDKNPGTLKIIAKAGCGSGASTCDQRVTYVSGYSASQYWLHLGATSDSNKANFVLEEQFNPEAFRN